MKSGVHTEKKRERPESGIYFEIFEKNTILNEHPLNTECSENYFQTFFCVLVENKNKKIPKHLHMQNMLHM